MRRMIFVLLLLLVLVGCARQGQPLEMALSPAQIETMNLETEILAPWMLPEPANEYHKQGLQAQLLQGETVVATMEFCKADRQFPAVGQYLVQEYTLFCRLSDTWGVIVSSQSVKTADLVDMVASLDVVYGPQTE